MTDGGVSRLGPGLSGPHRGPQDGRGPGGEVAAEVRVIGVVLVGDRGMLTQPQIDKIKQQAGWGWITAFTKRSNFVYTKIPTLADPRSACASCGLRANPRVGGWRAESCDWEQFRCTWDRLCTSSSSCQRCNEYIHGNILLRSAVPNPHIMNGLV